MDRRNWFAKHKFLTIIGALIVLIVGSAVANSGGGSSNTAISNNTTQKDSSTATGKASSKPAPKAPGIGDRVRDGKFEFVVTKVQPGVKAVGPAILAQKAQGQFVLVTMTVSNTSKEAQMFDASSQKMKDSSGATYDADSGASLMANGGSQTFLQNINPGNLVTGTVVFDVPATANLSSLELHDSPFSGGVKVSLK